jgi:hypothetical protein
MGAELQAQLRGTLLTPGQPGYDESRTIWNGMIDRRPALVARCVGVGDIVACVNFARAQNLPLSVKGGGHNIAGLAVRDGGTDDRSLPRCAACLWIAVARVARAPGWLPARRSRSRSAAARPRGGPGFVSNTGIAV